MTKKGSSFDSHFIAPQSLRISPEDIFYISLGKNSLQSIEQQSGHICTTGCDICHKSYMTKAGLQH